MLKKNLDGDLHLNSDIEGWSNDSLVKSTACYDKGPGFDSQQWHGSSQPPVTELGIIIQLFSLLE